MGLGKHPDVGVDALHLLEDPDVLGAADSVGDIPRGDLHRMHRCRLLRHENPQALQRTESLTPRCRFSQPLRSKYLAISVISMCDCGDCHSPGIVVDEIQNSKRASARRVGGFKRRAERFSNSSGTLKERTSYELNDGRGNLVGDSLSNTHCGRFRHPKFIWGVSLSQIEDLLNPRVLTTTPHQVHLQCCSPQGLEGDL